MSAAWEHITHSLQLPPYPPVLSSSLWGAQWMNWIFSVWTIVVVIVATLLLLMLLKCLRLCLTLRYVFDSECLLLRLVWQYNLVLAKGCLRTKSGNRFFCLTQQAVAGMLGFYLKVHNNPESWGLVW